MVCCSLLISLLQCLTSMIVEYILVSDEWYIILIINIFQFWAEFPFPGFYLWFDQINKKIFFRKYFCARCSAVWCRCWPAGASPATTADAGCWPSSAPAPAPPSARPSSPSPSSSRCRCTVLYCTNIVLYSTVMWIFFPGLTLHTKEGQDEKTGH